MRTVVKQKYSKEDMLWGYLMIAPTFLGVSLFALWPIVQSFYLSFTSWGAFGKYHWSGLDNYKRMLNDMDMWLALKNTFIFTGISVPLSISIAIVIAVLLNQNVRGVGIYRLLYYLPVITMPAASAMIWKWLYNGDYGLINYFLSWFGLNGPYWLTDPNTAIYALIVVAVWGSIGMNMVILLSGLQGISSSYYEAASMDGAGVVSKFFRITLPLLTPTIFFLVIITIISKLQLFELIFMMIGQTGITIKQTQTVVFLFFEEGFINGEKGYAAAIILVLFMIIMLFTALQFWLQKKWVHYD
jgi:multiple sugar transport system permease protein